MGILYKCHQVSSKAITICAPLPFVLDRQIAFDLLQQRGVPRLQAGQPPPEDDNSLEHLSTLPYSPDDIIEHYRGFPSLAGLQRCLSKRILNQRLHTFLHSDECSNADLLRITSCRHKSAARWMQPHPAFPTLSDLATTVPGPHDVTAQPLPPLLFGHLRAPVACFELQDAQTQVDPPAA